MCQSGFHCSKTIYQAFSYVQGEHLALVEVAGKSIKDDDKEVWQKMRVVKTWRWTKRDSVALSVYAAGLVLKNYEKEYPNDKRPREAILTVKRWLRTGSRKGLSAAWSAESARSAAWSAESAARSAAWSAESAARSAARSAAWSAESAARSALISKISKWMNRRIRSKK